MQCAVWRLCAHTKHENASFLQLLCAWSVHWDGSAVQMFTERAFYWFVLVTMWSCHWYSVHWSPLNYNTLNAAPDSVTRHLEQCLRAVQKAQYTPACTYSPLMQTLLPGYKPDRIPCRLLSLTSRVLLLVSKRTGLLSASDVNSTGNNQP